MAGERKTEPDRRHSDHRQTQSYHEPRIFLRDRDVDHIRHDEGEYKLDYRFYYLEQGRGYRPGDVAFEISEQF